MAEYVAPAGEAVDFGAIALPYEAPAGDAIHFNYISLWLDASASFNLDLSLSASAALVSNVSAALDLSFELEAAAGLVWSVSADLSTPLDFSAGASQVYQVSGDFGLDFGFAGAPAESWYVLAPFVGITRLPWSPQQRLEPEITAPHTQAAKKEPMAAIPWGELERIEADTAGGWDQVPPREQDAAIPWADLDRHPESAAAMGYREPGAKETEKVIPWGEFADHLETASGMGYREPGEKDTATAIPWDQLSSIGLQLGLGYSHPAPKDVEIPIISGPHWYPRWCIWQFVPPKGNALHFDFASLPPYAAPAGDNLHFAGLAQTDAEYICYDGTWNGPKDAYWYRPRPWIIPPPTLRSYYVIMNTVILRRVSDNVEIPITGMEISTDHDAWCWSLRASLRREIDLDMVRPSGGAPVEVEAEINGYLWRFVVEEYGHDRSFGRRGYSISGRSLSAYLAAPYSAPANVLETATRTAAQLADEALLYTGFTAELSIDDWLVTGGAYSLQNATPMQQLLTLAEAAGGVVHSDPRDTVIRLVPWYPALPWEWGAVTVDAALPTWQERRTSYQASTQYSGVYVSGQAKGVTCLVKRTGTDGSRQPQMATNALITATEPGLALGKKILADSGPRSIETIGAPLLQNPGLLTPGMIIEVADPAGNWRGMVIRTSITAQRPTVTQSIDVLRYYGT